MSFGQHRLAAVVARFASMHPRLRVTLRLEDRETDIVDEGIDLAVRIAYPSDSSLVARPIATDMAQDAGIAEIAEPVVLVPQAILAALETGEFHVFPDTMAKQIGSAYQQFATNVVEANLLDG